MPTLELTQKEVRLLHKVMEEYLDDRMGIGISVSARDLVLLEEKLKALVTKNDETV